MRSNKSAEALSGKTEKKGKRRIGLIAIGFGVIGTSGVLASAASLGVSTTGSLGTGVQVVAACDNDGVNVEYITGFSSATGRYEVTDVDITGIAPACYEKSLKITLRGPGATAGTYVALATASRNLTEVDAANVFTGHSRIALADPAFDSTTMNGAAIVIA
jgi:hypothetical protein